jgi:cyclophilin family peptidyl-prolyl cis-trans isomerase
MAIRVVFALIVIAVFAGTLAGCGDSGDSTATATVGANGCKEVEAPEPKDVSLPAPKQTVKKGEKLTAVVQTSCGTFEIALDTKQAPKTVNSFAYLADEGFYDDLTFHRVVSGFVIQGGDPLGTGAGGPGYSVDEAPPANASYTKGVVAMAKGPTDPPGRSGSQFFVVTSHDTGLPPEYALLGEVSEGYGAIARINSLATPSSEKPKQPVLIEKITIEKG